MRDDFLEAKAEEGSFVLIDWDARDLKIESERGVFVLLVTRIACEWAQSIHDGLFFFKDFSNAFYLSETGCERGVSLSPST